MLVIDGAYGFGNGRVIPAGPLRERICDGLDRADAIVLLGEDKAGVANMVGDVPILRAHVKPGPEAAQIASRRVIAFAGLARPEKFFRMLRDIGCEVVDTHAFADHHAYDAGQVERLCQSAGAADAQLVTTEKDAVRLPAEAPMCMEVLTISIEWEDEEALDRVLQPAMEARED